MRLNPGAILALALAALGLTAGCSSEGEHAGPQPTVPRFTLREIERTPPAPEETEPPFYALGGVRRLPDGTFLVLDTGDMQVKHAFLDGTILETWGGKGGGPGEFLHFFGLELTDSGHLLVNDPQQRRITEIVPGQDRVRIHAYPRWIQEEGEVFVQRVTSNGTVIYRTGGHVPSTSHPTGRTLLYDYLEVTLDGDLVHRYLEDWEDPYTNQSWRYEEGGSLTLSAPYTWFDSVCENDSLLLFASAAVTGPMHRLDLYSRNSGAFLESVDLGFPLIPVSANDVGEVFGVQTVRRMKTRIALPAYRTAVASLRLDDQGRLWVMRTGFTLRSDPIPPDMKQYDLFAVGTWRHVATVRTPGHVFIGAAGDTVFMWSDQLANQGTLLAYLMEEVPTQAKR